MPVQTHIHLGLTIDELTGEPEIAGSASATPGRYTIRLGGWDVTPQVPSIAERAITGKLHVHALLDNSGLPVHFVGDTLSLLVQTEDKNDLITMAGRLCYYVPLDHPNDGSPHTAISVFMSLRRGGVMNVDPLCTWWLVTVELQENK